MDANTDIFVDTASSTFADVDAITGTATINVVATDLVITGTDTMTAGDSNGNSITITAKDANGNIDDLGYNNITKAITFSGANVSGAGNNPTCSNLGENDIAFGSGTDILFTAGVGTTTMKLYKAEKELEQLYEQNKGKLRK